VILREPRETDGEEADKTIVLLKHAGRECITRVALGLIIEKKNTQ